MNYDSSNKAIYLQLADRVADAILSRELGDEQRLPSVREFAASMEVNANTAMRSYDRLAEKGLIYNKRGIGFFVCPGARAKVVAERGGELLDGRLEEIFGLLKELGVAPETLRDRYADFLNK